MIPNNLLNSCQSGFRPNDFCINQLISITHNIYRAFDANPSLEVRGVFLDLSKAFDNVWREGRGNTNGKCHSIQIELSKHKKLFSPERKTLPHIHHFFSAILKLSSVQIRSIRDLL